MTKNEDVSWMPVRVGRVSLKGFSTAELVAELATRDGVTQLIVDTDDCAFSCYAGPNTNPRWVNQCYGEGPCKILVVREWPMY